MPQRQPSNPLRPTAWNTDPQLYSHTSALTELDTLETKSHLSQSTVYLDPWTADLDPVAWRHADWVGTRATIAEALAAAGVPGSRQDHFRQCGSRAWLYRHDDTDPPTYVLHSAACHDRFCVPCGKARAYLIRRNLLARIRVGRCRFLTLTMRSAVEPLHDQLDRLYAAFTRLRRFKTWTDHVTGGAAFCEVKLNASGLGWHVHLHLVVTGHYFPHPLLGHAWHVATGDSFVVDIRSVRTDKQLGNYLTKYVTKPLDKRVLQDRDSLIEAILALRGRRLCFTFGSWRSFALLKMPSLAKATPICPFHELVTAARCGFQPAVHILSSIWSRLPRSWIPRTFTEHDPPPPSSFSPRAPPQSFGSTP